MVTVLAWTSVVALAVVLIFAAGIDALRGTPRSRWLSVSGGIALAYVFLKLLPELTRAQHERAAHHPAAGWAGEHLLFLAGLAGATLLFGIERAAKRTKQVRTSQGQEPRSAAWVFGLHAAVMSAYVAFIGYLLFREGEQRVRDVAVLGLVMALHFAGTAVALADDYRSLFTTGGRWVLAAAALAGGTFGYSRRMPDLAHHLLLSVLAGAVIFSVIKEEIPPEQKSRFWAVLAGVATTTGLLWAAG